MIDKDLPDGGVKMDPEDVALIKKHEKEEREKKKLNKEFRDIVNKG